MSYPHAADRWRWRRVHTTPIPPAHIRDLIGAIYNPSQSHPRPAQHKAALDGGYQPIKGLQRAGVVIQGRVISSNKGVLLDGSLAAGAYG